MRDLQGKSPPRDSWGQVGHWIIELVGLLIFTLFAAFLFSRV